MSVKPIPDGYYTITPHLVCRDAAKAIELYKKAFGAEELHRMPMPDGKIAHAEIKIGNSRVMLSDEFPDMGSTSPQTLGGTTGGLFIYHQDVDAAHKRAVEAGLTSKQPPMDMFWGDRYCKLEDAFGHSWAIGTHKEDLTDEEIAERGKKAMSEMMGG
jgi:PhnB protein